MYSVTAGRSSAVGPPLVGFPGLVPLLVGREREQNFLRQELASALGGHGRLVLLAGEAGIGKTTLVAALCQEAEAKDASVASGRCYEVGELPAFAPWHQLFAELPGVAPTSERLPPPFGDGEAPQSAYQLMSEVASYLGALSAARPLVLVLDDLHWADRDSLDLLDVVTRSLSRAPLLIIAIYRSDAVQRSHPLFDVLPLLQRDRLVTSLSLESLTVPDVARLVEANYGPCSPELAEYLHARAEGHPLFLVELVRDLTERRLLPRSEEGQLLPPTHPVEVPTLLRHLIAHRISRLGAEEETLLTVAAVIGEEWDLDVIEAVLAWEEEPLLRAMEAALRADVIVTVGNGERYRFRHGLFREVLYGGQLARRRKRLHQRVGAILEASAATYHGREAALAYHFASAEEWEKAVRYGIAAGDAARARFAGHSALSAYRQALVALERASPPMVRELEIGLHERLGQAYLLVGQPVAASEAFETMLRTAQAAGDRAAEGEALVWVSYVRRRQYQPAASEMAGEAGLRAAEELGEPRLLALAHWNLGHLFEIEGDLERAAHHGAEAERMARAGTAPDLLSRSLLVQAILAIWHGQYSEGQQLATEALVLTRDGHDGLAFASAYWRLGFALGELGQYALASRMLLEGIERTEVFGERYYLSKLLNTLGWLYNELGDPNTAREWNLRALRTVRASYGERVTEAERYALLNLATDELASGNSEVAAEYLRTFEPLLEQHEYGRIRYLNRYQLVRGELALARNDPLSALRAADEASLLATEKVMPKNAAKSRFLAGRALLMQGHARDAAESLADGVLLADSIAHGSLRWQGRLWLGHALRAMHRDASQTYREAMEHVELLARGLDDDRLRAIFLASALVGELRDALLASEAARPVERPAGLTARELDVLRLLARHRTDKEIAEALFLSPRTVSTHVTNILIKLNVTNRREAAGAAVDLGLD
jgi:DNA-binding CsgD family transcriptional regulator/tetratricopeptide (TPR) repeat protein